MNLNDFLAACRFPRNVELQLKAAGLPEQLPDEMPEALTAACFARYAPLFGIPEDISQEAARIEALARQTPALRIYANLVEQRELYDAPLPRLYETPAVLPGELAGVFHLMLAAGALPRIAETHARLGLPESFTEGHARWIGGAVGIHRSSHDGRPGFLVQQLHWLKFAIEGTLFRIGRFEYRIHTVPEFVPAIYRSCRTGEIATLCRDGWRIGPDGFRVTEGGTLAALEWENGMLTGIPVDFTTGRAKPETLTLDLAEFKPVLTPHEWVPSVHIPGGGGMTPELARASFAEAVAFFRDVFKKEINCFVCNSWILNPDWLEFLPDSNLTKFMRMLRLFPMPPNPRSGLFFIFGREDEEWSHYPADNSIRRAFHQVRESGRPLREGGMVFLTSDLVGAKVI